MVSILIYFKMYFIPEMALLITPLYNVTLTFRNYSKLGLH